MQIPRWQAKLARSEPLGHNLQSSLRTGETAGLHFTFVKRASDAQGCDCPRLRFLPDPPDLAKASQAVSRQGGVDEGPIDGVNDAINSTVSTAALVLGGKETGEESTKEHCISI
jgi:hypothetical protein